MDQQKSHRGDGNIASWASGLWGEHAELVDRKVVGSSYGDHNIFTNIVNAAGIKKDVRVLDEENREYEKLVNDLKTAVITLSRRTQELAQANVDHETLGALHDEHERQMKEYATKNLEYQKSVQKYNLYGRLMGHPIPQPPSISRLSHGLILKSARASGTPQHPHPSKEHNPAPAPTPELKKSASISVSPEFMASFLHERSKNQLPQM